MLILYCCFCSMPNFLLYSHAHIHFLLDQTPLPPSLLFLQDLLNTEPDSSFEEHFYRFRVKVKELEQRLVWPLKQAFDEAPTLSALLRVLELYQGICRRESIKVPEISAVFIVLELLGRCSDFSG